MEDAAGLRVQGRRRRELGPQLHDPQPDRRIRAAGADHLADRLGPGDQPGAHRHQADCDRVARRRRQRRRSTRSSTPSAASTATATASSRSPTRCPTDPAAPGYEERAKISTAAQLDGARGRPDAGLGPSATCIPGGLSMDMKVARDGPDAGSTAGDDPSEIKPLFRSDAHYYEPAGAVSWDVAMTATRPELAGQPQGRRHGLGQRDLRRAQGVLVRVDGDLPLEVSTAADPLAKDPFDDAAAVEAMYEQGGILTHGRLPENIDKQGGQGPQASRPAQAAQQGRRVPDAGSRSTASSIGPAATRPSAGFPPAQMRPPVVKPGARVTLHQPRRAARRCPTPSRSGTASPPARRPATGAPGSAIRSPRGPIKFDSGQLGFGTGAQLRGDDRTRTTTRRRR